MLHKNTQRFWSRGGITVHKSYLLSAVLLSSSFFISTELQASSRKSICGTSDQRELSYDPKVARARAIGDEAGCTVTMIGKSCAVSAGHCTSTFDIVEFNIPDKPEKGDSTFAAAEDTYTVAEDSVMYRDNGRGNDWAVLRLNQNPFTQKFAGDVQGHYEISTKAPQSGETLRISGHGYADNPMMSFAQLSHKGELVEVTDGGAINHKVDTTGGSSGSSIIHDADNKIIGVHTHGGCFDFDASKIAIAGGNEDLAAFYDDLMFFPGSSSSNGGTAFYGNSEFQAAVNDCLAWEEENL